MSRPSSFMFHPFALCLIAILGLSSCANQQAAQPAANADGDNSRVSLDWPGVYKGLLPCADCEGIQTTITLGKDNAFTRSMNYLGKPNGQFADQGLFAWDNKGERITLTDQHGQSQSYRVGEGRLFHLSQQGQRISGENADRYILLKNLTDARIENKRWQLSELMGQAVVPDPGQKTAYLQFDSENARVAGNASCNNFFGSYELREGDRINLSQLGSTMMACQNMNTESAFLQVLQKADNYAVKDDTLSLHKARMAPLARFKRVVDEK